MSEPTTSKRAPGRTPGRRRFKAISKTTVNLPTVLLDEAKKVAEEEGVTLRELIESGLEGEIASRRQQRDEPFELRDASFTGNGLQPEWAGLSMGEIIHRSYPVSRGGEPWGEDD